MAWQPSLTSPRKTFRACPAVAREIWVDDGARLRPLGYDVAAFATSWLAQPKQAQPAKAGGARRDRTADLVIANDALSQLSYGPFVAASKSRERPAIGAIYNPRQGQVKNGEIADFP